MKLTEKLNNELSLSIWQSLINDYKEQKRVNHGRFKNMHLWSDIWNNTKGISKQHLKSFFHYTFTGFFWIENIKLVKQGKKNFIILLQKVFLFLR